MDKPQRTISVQHTQYLVIFVFWRKYPQFSQYFATSYAFILFSFTQNNI